MPDQGDNTVPGNTGEYRRRLENTGEDKTIPGNTREHRGIPEKTGEYGVVLGNTREYQAFNPINLESITSNFCLKSSKRYIYPFP